MNNTRRMQWGDTVMEFNRETGAHIAMLLTRRALGRKSANKVRMESVTVGGELYSPVKTKPDTMDRTIENMKLMNTQLRGSDAGRLFVERLNGGIASWDDIQRYAMLVRTVGTGNCLEYAVVAFAQLHADGWTGLELVQLAPPSTHFFVVLGSARPIGSYAASFDLGPDAVICDPWAHVSCPCGIYRTEWAGRMAKWTAERKVMMVPNGSIQPSEYGLDHRQVVMFSLA